ncbi:DUF3631 domain-containing protein [Geobacter sulfurreducens subsp. ethanolicus]|uniref:DUF3631 domain-containing protein n=1 Tax=Geobacter sulfurreducens TaxID=35554 RepID=UPI002572F0E7|nr:DUF3631 domain-containing protein [Geobacter sulfurreducens]BEH09858.1 DUF3631 domain-containing protein [Geobacter sulfurreducens subsp. ethanolicus]
MKKKQLASSKSNAGKDRVESKSITREQRQAVQASPIDDATLGDEDINFNDPTPWPKRISPEKLLDRISNTIRRFVICSPEVADATTLWIAFTWFIEVVTVAPIAFITSPEKRCAKTILLTLIGELAKKSIQMSHMTPAAMYRTIHQWTPTILVDEADTFIKGTEDFRGILNSGHTRKSAFIIRCDSKSLAPKRFSTWGAKAIASIGSVADTVMDRSIVLELKRKLPTEQVERLRHATQAKPQLFDKLRSKLARIAIDYKEQVRRSQPVLPTALNDRAQDNWEPLLAVASIAGEKWVERGTTAAISLSGKEDLVKSLGTQLLTDIHDIFVRMKVSRLATESLIMALHTEEEWPWKGMNLSAQQLASMLRPYGIKSRNIRVSNTRIQKGYFKKAIDEAYSRYSSPPPK